MTSCLLLGDRICGPGIGSGTAEERLSRAGGHTRRFACRYRLRAVRSLAPPPFPPALPTDQQMIRRYLRQLGLLVLLVIPGSVASAQTGRFDLEKTKAVLTP